MSIFLQKLAGWFVDIDILEFTYRMFEMEIWKDRINKKKHIFLERFSKQRWAAGYMQRFNPGCVRGPRSTINSVIFTNRWEFMCIFKLCSVFTPHWLIGHGLWARARGLDQSRPAGIDQWQSRKQMLGFRTMCTVILPSHKKWLPSNIKPHTWDALIGWILLQQSLVSYWFL